MTVFKQCFRMLLIILTTASHLHSFQYHGSTSAREKKSSAQDIKFERISTEQGLSHNSVVCIYQDRSGYLWIGTREGLNRYDGYQFEIYKNIPSDSTSLSSNQIAAVYEDSSSVLWIGTTGGGLNRFDRRTESFTRYRHDTKNPHSISHDAVMSILEDGTGRLWIATMGGGLNEYHPTVDKFYHYKHDPDDPNSLSNNNIFRLFVDRSGILWIGTIHGGLNKLVEQSATGSKESSYRKNGGRTVKFISYTHDSKNPRSLSHNNVWAIFEDGSGVLWIGTQKGLDKFDRASEQFIHYKHDPNNPNSLGKGGVDAIHEDKRGNLWLGTQFGLNQFNLQTERFTLYQHDPYNPQSLTQNAVTAIYEDRSGVLWFGTLEGGLNKVNLLQQNFTHISHDPRNSNSLSHASVASILEEDNEILWVGTWGGGMNKIIRKKGSFKHYINDPNDPRSLSNNNVVTIHSEKNGWLWIGTAGGGLNKFNPKTEEFIHYKFECNNPNSLSHNHVFSIYEDRSGVFWIGTYGGGLNKFSPSEQKFIRYQHDPNNPYSISSDFVTSIYEDRAGTLWIGTDGGLNRFGRQEEKFVQYLHDGKNSNSLSNNTVQCIIEDSSEILWIGTTIGLNRFDRRAERFTHYFEEDGLPNNVILRILEDNNGKLWISTFKGLSKFDPQTEIFRNYYVSDGIQDNEFSFGAGYKNKKGEMFFGTPDGLVSFFPDSIKENSQIPPVVITNFEIFNQPVSIATNGTTPLKKSIDESDEINLSYKDYVFSFEFAALDFTAPEKNRYAYMMEGFHEDWIDLGTRNYVSFTNLDPGNYTFKVKGANSQGVWNEAGKSIRVIISPPIWKTWWFRILALFGTVSLLAFVYYRRVSHLKQAKTAQERFTKRLIEVQEKERQRIASELHDSLGQNLLVISNAVQQATSLLPDKSKAKDDLQLVSETAADALNDVREISSNLHPHQLDRLGLKKAIESMAHKMAQSANIDLSLELIDLKDLFAKDDEINIYRIVQEGMNNIVKHSDANATVRFTEERQVVTILIQDDGKGFDKKSLDTRQGDAGGFGLTNISERVKILQGKLKVVSAIGKGTSLEIKIPIKDSQDL